MCKLKEWRKSRRLTKESMAKKLGITGVTVHAWENETPRAVRVLKKLQQIVNEEQERMKQKPFNVLDLF